MIVFGSAPVTSNVGPLTDVMSSVELTPVSLAACRSGAFGAAGEVVSSVNVNRAMFPFVPDGLVEAIELDALALVDENESLAQRSYEAGQISLADLLLIRREALELRHVFLSRLLEATQAGIHLEASAGALL